MSTAIRYTLLQVPGWILTGIVCTGLWWAGLLGGWAVAVLVAVWIGKDALLYPLVRRAYEPAEPPWARLIGARAIARQALAPTGYVELHGQLWRAELLHDGSISPGEAVRVQAVEGLTLRVVAEGSDLSRR
jgi:membrane protein implicated in regulation of membrane protease activity